MEWGLKSKAMIRELLKQQPNPFLMTIQADPSQWEEALVARAFAVPRMGLPMLQKGDIRLSKYFAGRMDPKEGGLVK